MKMLLQSFCIFSFCLVANVYGAPATIDYERSIMGFEVRSGNRSIQGEVAEWSAIIEFDIDQPEDASFAVNIDVNSITVSDPLAQTIILTEAWLASQAYPTAAFASETISPQSDMRYMVSGLLSLRGQIAFTSFSIELAKDGEAVVAEVIGTINRDDFGVGSGFCIEIVQPEISIFATVVFIP